jgi:hypothetical protein
MRHNVLPGEYYAYALWRPERKANIDNYLYAREGPRLFKLLNRPAQPNPIDDKLEFHKLCQAHGVPSPEILAAFAPTTSLIDFASAQPPKRDLFVKPCIGLGREGTEHFRWDGCVFDNRRGRRLAPPDLKNYLANRARNENRTLLVQPALSNHLKLGIGPNATLATARLITGLSRDGVVVSICAFFSYFAETDPLDHLKVALIDVGTGRLISEPCERSTENLHAIPCDMLVLPDWEAVLRYATIAHLACPNYVFIGWDAVFTDDGPMLLEGNLNWCADEYQRLRGEPLGLTKFAEVLAGRLEETQLRAP